MRPPNSYAEFKGRLTGKSDAVDRLLGSLVVDSSKIRRELGWSPPFTIEQGLNETAEWFKTLSHAGAKKGYLGTETLSLTDLSPFDRLHTYNSFNEGYMPTISMFYGIIIRMLFMDTQQHHLPHIHVEYQGMKAVVAIPGGELLEGNLPGKKLRMLQTWIDIHEEELMADWSLAAKGEPVFPIEPLR